MLRACSPDEIAIAVSFLSGGTRQGNIGIGYSTLQGAAIAPAANPSLSLLDVDRTFGEIASVRGTGAEGQRREMLQRMLAQATLHEQEFVMRLLMGELRQGALAGLMLDGLARATNVSLDHIRRAAMMAGGVAAIAKALLEEGEAGLSRFSIQLFQPVQPMLAQTAEDVGEAIHDLGEAALEYKFDGARVQVHKSGDEVRVFSRRLNEVTAAVPEVVEAVLALPARTLVLDGEVLSLDAADRPQPFQVTMRRFGRKLDVNRMRAELPLRPFWFDLIYLDDASLADESQRRRFAALSEIVPSGSMVPHLVTADLDQAEDFLHASLAHGHEGIMAKATDAGYAAGARGQSWLKIKKPRTLDLVILAAEWGHGRRTGFLSNLHLGARDTVKGGFAMLGKTFKGLTDEMLAWQTAELLKIEIARDAYTVFVEPKIVVEIAFNEIQVSPRYASGLALRFARVKRYRPDKSAADADTFETVQKLAGGS
jgi:DNA ligase 1